MVVCMGDIMFGAGEDWYIAMVKCTGGLWLVLVRTGIELVRFDIAWWSVREV